MTVYATAADYLAIIGEVGPANIARLLYLASIDIDTALMSSVYDVADTVIVAALKEATVEQAKWRIANGYSEGMVVVERGASIGSVTLSPSNTITGASAAAGVQGLAPVAWQILQRAGVTGGAPITHVGSW